MSQHLESSLLVHTPLDRLPHGQELLLLFHKWETSSLLRPKIWTCSRTCFSSFKTCSFVLASLSHNAHNQRSAFFNLNNFILIAYEYFLVMESERRAVKLTVLYFGITILLKWTQLPIEIKKGIVLIKLLKISAPILTFKSFLQSSDREGNLISLQKSQ